MKSNNVLHFAKVKMVSALEAGEPSDSGNGYYSYSYYTLPYTGEVTEGENGNIGKVASILHKRHYNYPFTSLGTVKVLERNQAGAGLGMMVEVGGVILYSVTYHHGD
jgi:hypothetical protein